MILTCEKCDTSFSFDESLIKPSGSKVRCSKCRNVFVVQPPAPAAQANTGEEDLLSGTAAAAGVTGLDDLDLAAIEKSLDLDIDREPDAGLAAAGDVATNDNDLNFDAADFAAAAGRAAEAGFDGVEIHGAHFYLISQFLSPLTNQRNDRYGGDARARATFALEVVRSVRERLGKSYPILFRLNAVEKVEGGQTLEDALVVSKLLADEGVDVLDVSLIANSSWKEIDDRRILVATSAFSKKQPAAENVPPTAAVKEATGLPVIAVGKLGEGDVAVKSVRDLPIDIVAIGRQMIADPDAAGKILAGNGDRIVRCVECMTCFATIGRGKPMGCKVNRNLPGSRRSA